MKKLSGVVIVLAAVSCLFTIVVTAKQGVDPQQGVAVLKTAFALNDPDWQFAVYPVDNFGVATGYNFTPGQPTRDKDFICATFGCLQISPAPAVGSDPWKKVNGFAELGNGGALTIHSDSKSTFGLSVILPGILKLIKADFSADYSKNVTVDIEIPGGAKRMLDRGQFVTAINGMASTLPLKKAYLNGTLDYVIGDLIVDSMTMNISVDRSKNLKADAELTQAKGILDANSSLNMNMGTSGQGTYKLTVSKPVILAYLHRRQPAAGESAQTVNWDNWVKVNAPIQKTP
jgi:hypothetical protein